MIPVHSLQYRVVIAFLCLSIINIGVSPVTYASDIGIHLEAGNHPKPSTSADPTQLQITDGTGERVAFSQGAPTKSTTENDVELAGNQIAPLSISRIYAAIDSNTTLVTVTLTNHLLPTVIPTANTSASAAELRAVLDNFNPLDDPNTVRGVILVDTLNDTVNLVESSPLPDRQEKTFVWNLGAIAPLQSVVATFELQHDAAGTEFVALDTGATAWGFARGRETSVSATPIQLLPDSFGDFLRRTVDADTQDEVMLKKIGELGQDPQQIFAYVRTLDYNSYRGSLRGTRGTLWGEAGNSLDKSSLLIAMLRASGIPARYRHGMLSKERAQQLIQSMFPETSTGVVGYVPAGTETSDPVNDPDLIAESQDHWWAEVYLPTQGWRDLDPSFADAQIGDNFTTETASDGSDRVVEIPASQRHKVTIKLKIEKWDQLSALLPNGLPISYPLSETFNAVELAANPVTLAHIVDSNAAGGLVFSVATNTYTPYFVVGQREIVGTPYQDLLTNFPLGSSFVSGGWLVFELIHPNGIVQSYQREIKDRVGIANRQTGGTSNIKLDATSTFVTPFDLFTTWFWPNLIPQKALVNAGGSSLDDASFVGAEIKQIETLISKQSSLTSTEQVQLRTLQHRLQELQTNLLNNAGILFGTSADQGLREISQGFLVKAYFDAPRIVTIGTTFIKESLTFSIDLRRTTARVLPYPGQNKKVALFAFNSMKGLVESSLEGITLEKIVIQPALTASRVFELAEKEGIQSTWITEQSIGLLQQSDVSPTAKARINLALQKGKLILMPQHSVNVDGQARIGWWEVDPITGETIGVMEEGLHQSLTEGLIIVKRVSLYFVSVSYVFIGFASYTLNFIGSIFENIESNNGRLDIKAAYRSAEARFSEISNAGTALACAVAAIEGSDDRLWGATKDCTVQLALGDFINAYPWPAVDAFSQGAFVARQYMIHTLNIDTDPPLPTSFVSLLTQPPVQNTQRKTIPGSRTLSQEAINGSIQTAGVAISGTTLLNWGAQTELGLPFNQLSLTNASVYNKSGSLVAQGSLQVLPIAGTGTFKLFQSDHFAQSNGNGMFVFHAAALPSISGSAAWHSFSVQLTSTLPYSLSLQAVKIKTDANTLLGDFSIQSKDGLQIQGAGNTLTPNFADMLSLQVQNAQIQLSPSTGTISVGGITVETANGVAFANYAGQLRLTPDGATLDRVEMSGSTDLFTLSLSSNNSLPSPGTEVSFGAVVNSSFDDLFLINVESPKEWATELTADATINVTPNPKASPGTYEISVSAQSKTYPALSLSAIHRVTIAPHQGVTLQVEGDDVTSVPWGSPTTAQANGTNNGQFQANGAAFTANLANLSTDPHSFILSVSGLPSNWLILSGAETGGSSTKIKLDAGGRGAIGIYVAPPAEALPAAGTSFNFTVNAVADDGSGLSATASQTFVAPAIPFGQIQAEPPVIYSAAGQSTQFEVGLRNVGNASGSLPLIIDTPYVTWTANYQNSIALSPSQVNTQTITLETPAGEIGQQYIVKALAPSGAYTQSASVVVRLVSQDAACLYKIADAIAALNEATLEALTRGLSHAVVELESERNNPQRRNTVAEALSLLSKALGDVVDASQLTELRTIAQRLSMVDSSALPDDLANLCAALRTLQPQIAVASQYKVEAHLTPGLAAALLGQVVHYHLLLMNQGTLNTTYSTTVAAPGLNQIVVTSLVPGQSATIPISITPTDLGFYSISAETVALDSSLKPQTMRLRSTAGINVVDAFVRVLDVTANPPFVDTGVSSTTLSVQIANVANIMQPALIRTSIVDDANQVQYTKDVSVTIRTGDLQAYPLGVVDTSGWASGVYSVGVEIFDPSGNRIPGGLGHDYFVAGQVLQVFHKVTPTVVLPGNATVTTEISTTTNVIGASEISRNLVSQSKDINMRRVKTPTGVLTSHGDETCSDVNDIIFYEDFESEGPPQLSYANLFQWKILDGSVDLLGRGFHDWFPDLGQYIDLDGSSLNAARIETKSTLLLTAGEYDLSFRLVNNAESPTANSVDVSLGNLYSETVTLPLNSPLTTLQRIITATEPTNAQLVFDHEGGDYYGLILDNIVLKKISSTRLTSTVMTNTMLINARSNVFAAGHRLLVAPSGGGGGIFPPFVQFSPSRKHTVTFPQITGQVSCVNNGSMLYDAEGGKCPINNSTDIQSVGGISGILHENTMFLAGVFLNDSEPVDPAPSRLDFTNNSDFEEIAPELNQMFFIGNGKTSAGAFQRFIAPPNTTRLAIGFADAFNFVGLPGWYEDNLGELQAEIRIQSLAPAYQIEVSHILPIFGVDPIANSFSTTPVITDTTYVWSYGQGCYSSAPNISFAANLPNMKPGEIRPVSESTEISYSLQAGSNRLLLPPLYVSAPHIISISPPTRSVSAGSVVTHEVTLTNPGLTNALYILSPTGLPGNWSYQLPVSITIPANTTVTLPFTISLPSTESNGVYPFVLEVETNDGATDIATAQVAIQSILQLAVSPPIQSALFGETITYTLALTNVESSEQTYRLAVTGVEKESTTIQPIIKLAAGASATLPITVLAQGAPGNKAIQVSATYSSSQPNTLAQDQAILSVLNGPAVEVVLTPTIATAGQFTAARFAPLINNRGTLSDTYRLEVSAPSGWSWQLLYRGQPITQLMLPPSIFNSASLDLLVTAPIGTPIGQYEVLLKAVSQVNPRLFATTTGKVNLTKRGVNLALAASSNNNWTIQVTNSGSEPDTFDLSITGLMHEVGKLGNNSVSLAPGSVANVSLGIADLSFIVPGSYPFLVIAKSQADPAISDDAQGQLDLPGSHALDIELVPEGELVSENKPIAIYALTVNNNGSQNDIYTLSVTADADKVTAKLETAAVYVPAHSSAVLLLKAQASETGVYPLTVQANSATSGVSDSVTTQLTAQLPKIEPVPATTQVYLPIIANISTSVPRVDPSFSIYLPTVSR